MSRLTISLLAAAMMAVCSGCPKDAPDQAADPPDAAARTVPDPAAQSQPGAADAPGSTAPAGDADAVVQNPPGLVTADFKVEGMTCEDCSRAIEGTLIRVPGVSTVSADDKNGTARVQYDPGKVKPEALIEAIDELKYKATLVSESEPGKAKETSR